MKKFFTIIFILFIPLFNIAKANNNLAFIDMDKILSKSKPGLAFVNQLKELNKNNIENFKKSEKILKEKEAKLISQKNVISEDQFKKEVIQLKSDIKKYNDEKKKTITNFNSIKINNTNKLIQLINPLLKKYADEFSISVILQKKDIVMGKSEYDITDKMIVIVNKDIKEFKIK